jgi:hypothetical protein
VNETQRKRWEALHVDLAAAWLRSQAWEQSYAGSGRRTELVAFAAFRESVSVQLDRIPDGLRVEAVRTAEWLVGCSQAVRF